MESNDRPRLTAARGLGSTPPASNPAQPAHATIRSYAIVARNSPAETVPPASPSTPQPTRTAEPTAPQPDWGTAKFSDIPMLSFQKGQIFRAIFEHPYHQNQPPYPRYYLVVGEMPEGKGPLTSLTKLFHEICVVGLETNGGQGRYCYDTSRLRFIKGIRKYASYPKPDENSFYVAQGSDWEPRENTVIDLTTVLRVGSRLTGDIRVEMIANLTNGSINSIDRCYTALSRLPSPLDTLMATKTLKQRGGREDTSCKCCYCQAGEKCPFPPVLGKQKAAQTNNVEDSGATLQLYDPKRDGKFWTDRFHELQTGKGLDSKDPLWSYGNPREPFDF